MVIVYFEAMIDNVLNSLCHTGYLIIFKENKKNNDTLQCSVATNTIQTELDKKSDRGQNKLSHF